MWMNDKFLENTGIKCCYCDEGLYYDPVDNVFVPCPCCVNRRNRKV